MKKRSFQKKPLSFPDQLQKLKDRNLTVSDEPKALHYLAQISYYRLSAYFLPYKKIKDSFDPNIPIQYIGIPSDGQGQLLAWQNEALWK